MDKIIGLKELREKMPEYEKKIAEGNSYLVVKKSRPIFRISPPESETEEMWEGVVDFTRIEKGGVALDDILSRL